MIFADVMIVILHELMTKKLKNLPLLAMIVIFASLLRVSDANAGITEITLPTAADGDVKFQIDADNKLPLDAADAKAKVVTAGFTFFPKEKGEPLQWSWQYKLKFAAGVTVKSITVEDERDAKIILLIRDDSPNIQDGVWTGFEEKRELTKSDFDGMQTEEPWILIRRITVNYDDNTQSKLHQLIVHTQAMRMRLLDDLMTEIRTNGK